MKALHSFSRMIGGRMFGVAALALASGLFASSPALAQQAGQQQMKPSLEKQVGDWTVLCFDQNGGSYCRMSETLVNKKTGMRVLSMGFRYFPVQKKSIMEVVVPLAVALQNGVVIDTDTYKSGALQYTICVSQGCQALVPAENDVIGKLGRATKGKVEIVDNASGKKVAIAFPLTGFSEAYSTMVASSHAGSAAAAASAN